MLQIFYDIPYFFLHKTLCESEKLYFRPDVTLFATNITEQSYC